MILGEDNRERWSSLDVLIMHAYQRLEDERCSQCGMPMWLCRNEDTRLQVRIKWDKCMVAMEVDDARRRMSDKDEYTGNILPEVYSLDERPLESYRRPYYDTLARRRAEDEED